MEGPLECPHAVFQVHPEESLFNPRRRVMKRQQVGIVVCVMFRPNQYPVPVQRGDDADGLGQEPVGLADHFVAFLKFGPHEVFRMALLADGGHAVALPLPVFLGQPGHVGLPDHLQARCGAALRIQHAEGLQNRGPVLRPLRIFRQGQPDGQKPPRGPHAMVSLGHVAGLARGRRGVGRQRAVLLEQVPDAVLGGRVHLPLWMVEAHVARPARLRFHGLLHREEMTGVADVAGRQAEQPVLRLDRLDFVLGLEADAVASAAALHPFCQGHRQKMGRRHGVHAGPGEGVLAPCELLDLDRMARCAYVRGGDPGQGDVVLRAVPDSMAHGAVHPVRAVGAEFPVRHDAGRGFPVAVHAIGRGHGLFGRRTAGCQYKYAQ